MDKLSDKELVIAVVGDYFSHKAELLSRLSKGQRAGEAIEKALELIFEYGQIDGAHHKAWVIDQVVRILCGKEYEKEIADYKNGEDGADTYEWNIGIAP
jgi:hypothetical protein